MSFEDRLIWYQRGRFTSADVTRGTGLSERSQRELAKLGILPPIPQAKTKARLFDARMFKRAAIIAPLNKGGFSLEVAGRITYAAPLLEQLWFSMVDPPGVGPRREWFDPGRPPATEVNDYLIEIIDAHYVVHSTDAGPAVFGEIFDDPPRFIWWSNAVEYAISNYETPEWVDLGPRWNWDRSMDDKALKFDVGEVSENDKRLAKQACENPYTKLTINAGLALRIALRRLLYIDDLAQVK
jgi:hypothetical protein